MLSTVTPSCDETAAVGKLWKLLTDELASVSDTYRILALMMTLAEEMVTIMFSAEGKSWRRFAST